VFHIPNTVEEERVYPVRSKVMTEGKSAAAAGRDSVHWESLILVRVPQKKNAR
jgi:hypothetical protein